MRKVLLLPLVALLLAADDPKTDKVVEDDQAATQGTWMITKWIGDGQDASADELKKMKAEFKGKQMIGRRGDHVEQCDFVLDARKSPKQITMKGGNQKEIKGIYELKGRTLKICIALLGDRPKEFKSLPGSNRVLMILKREQK